MRYLLLAAIAAMGCGAGGGAADMRSADMTASGGHCSNGIKDGDETDVDCGGSRCSQCADGKTCLLGTDCTSLSCTNNLCGPVSVDGGDDLSGPTCNDGVQNGDETDVDCGGSCPTCGLAMMCMKGSDCTSGRCVANKCAAPLTIGFAGPVIYPPAGSRAEMVAVADLNGDKKQDMVVAVSGNITGASVLLGNGDGTFKPATLYAADADSYAVAVGDCDNDGKPDVVVANLQAGMSFLRGNGDGTLAAPSNVAAGAAPDSISLADLNQDGKLDAIVSNDTSGIEVLLGNGNGTFHSSVHYPADLNSQNNVVADFNGDQNLDVLVVSAQSNDVSLLLGKGNGTFMNPSNSPTGGMSPVNIAVGDLNRDGRPDAVAANLMTHELGVLLNSGNGAFGPAVTYPLGNGASPRCVAVADFNLDGKPDLAVPEASMNQVAIFLGKGDGTFPAAPVLFVQGQDSNFATVGDFNGDGRPDLAIADGAGVFVLINTSQ